MTICIATNLYFPVRGGVPNYYHYLAQSLVACNHKVIVLKPDFSAEDKDDQIEKQNNITIITLCRSYNKHYHYFKKYFRPGGYQAHLWLAMGHAMKEWLIENATANAIDLIEVPDYGGLAILLKHDSLPPILVNGHVVLSQLSQYDFIPESDHTKVIKKLESLSFQYADGIVSHSILNQRNLETITQEPVFFARAPWIAPNLSLTNEKKREKYITVGELSMIKGPTILAEAIRIIKKKEPNFKLEWIGHDKYTAPGGEKVSTYLQRNYPDLWNTNFIWNGPLEHQQIFQKTASAQLAILPTQWETFNYFALEAAYFSTPLIMTEQTGSQYLFKDFPEIKIIPSGSSHAIADAYFEMKEQKHTEGKHSNMLQNHLKQYFSPENIIADRLEIYKLLLEKKKYNSEIIHNELKFLNDYFTTSRKNYYYLRKAIKSLFIKKQPGNE